jgi:hypothetical protein
MGKKEDLTFFHRCLKKLVKEVKGGACDQLLLLPVIFTAARKKTGKTGKKGVFERLSGETPVSPPLPLFCLTMMKNVEMIFGVRAEANNQVGVI